MTKARTLGYAAALAALAVMTWRIGLTEIARQFRNLGAVLPVIVVASAARLLVQTRAWAIALRADGICVPQSRLIAVRLASQAASYLVALGPVVSEPAKLVLLRGDADADAAAPATFVETGAYWLTTVILGLAGTCAAAFYIADARVVWASAVLFGVAFALLGTRRSLFSPLVRWAGPKAPKWLRSAENVELRIRSFRDRHASAARKILLLEWIAQAFTLAEVAAVMWAAGIRFSFAHVLAIETAGRIAKILGVWIPGRFGADEGGAVVSFALLGFSPAAGLMLVFARRVRDLLWCAAGIVWMAHSRSRRPAPAYASTPASLCLEER